MIRNVLGIVLLLLLPTIVYLAYTLLTKPDRPPRAAVDEAPFVWLGLAGIVLAFATLIYYGATTTEDGVDRIFTPAPDGQVRPGR
jgi:hypothetical protein